METASGITKPKPKGARKKRSVKLPPSPKTDQLPVDEQVRAMRIVLHSYRKLNGAMHNTLAAQDLHVAALEGKLAGTQDGSQAVSQGDPNPSRTHSCQWEQMPNSEDG